MFDSPQREFQNMITPPPPPLHLDNQATGPYSLPLCTQNSLPPPPPPPPPLCINAIGELPHTPGERTVSTWLCLAVAQYTHGAG